MNTTNTFCVIILFVSAFGWSSCNSSKRLTENAVYFKNISDSMLQKTAGDYEPVFQKGDILSIKVITPNENSARLFNQATFTTSPANGGQENANASSNSGYLVN